MHECRGRWDAQERLSWAQRLKRVFRIDIESCERCGGKVRIIASIEDPQVIGRILAHLEQTVQARVDFPRYAGQLRATIPATLSALGAIRG